MSKFHEKVEEIAQGWRLCVYDWMDREDLKPPYISRNYRQSGDDEVDLKPPYYQLSLEIRSDWLIVLRCDKLYDDVRMVENQCFVVHGRVDVHRCHYIKDDLVIYVSGYDVFHVFAELYVLRLFPELTSQIEWLSTKRLT